MNEKVKQALKDISYVSGISVKSVCRESYETLENFINEAEEHEKELIAEQQRLFDLAKEQEEALEIIARHTKITKHIAMAEDIYIIDIHLNELSNRAEFDLVKKVVEKYGK